MTLRAIKTQNLQTSLLIMFFTLANHGLILFNDGVFWDDWINYIALLDKDWEKLFFVYLQAGGIPLSAYVHWVFSYAPNIVFAYRIVALLCISGSSFFIYWIGRHKLGLGHPLALLAAIIALGYPAYQMSATMVGTALWLYYLFFLIGGYLALLSFEERGPKAVILRLLALFLLFLSYRFEVLLLLSYVIVLIDIFSHVNETRDLLSFLNPSYLVKKADLLILPIVYWGFSHSAFVGPLNENYNQFNFESSGPSMIAFLNNTFFQQGVRIGEILLLIWPFALIAALISWLVAKRLNLLNFPRNSKTMTKLLVFGLVLFFLALIPPVLVGKAGSSIGYGTRHALALGWPVGLLVVTISCLVAARFPKSERALSAVLVFLLLAFAAVNSFTYLTWQARWAKDQSVMQQLSESPNAKDFAVYSILDNFPVPGLESYRFYEWAGMFRLIWGDETRAGFQEGYYSAQALIEIRTVFLKHFNTENADLHGCYARLQIDENLKMPLPEVGLRYVVYRMFFPERLKTFLNVLTTVEVSPIDNNLETSCPEN